MARLAILAVLLLPAPAAAAPIDGAEYTGDPGLVYVSKDGRKVTKVMVTLPTKCRIGNVRPRYPTTLGVPPRGVAIRRGAFTYRKLRRFTQTGAVMSEMVKGRFSADGKRVSITARYWLKRRDGGCDTGTRRYSMPITGLVGSVPWQGRFSGRTEAGEPIAMTVSGGRVTAISVRVTLRCDDGTTTVRELSGLEAPVEDGEFRAVSGRDEVSGFVRDIEIEGEVSASALRGTGDDAVGCFGGSRYTVSAF